MFSKYYIFTNININLSIEFLSSIVFVDVFSLVVLLVVDAFFALIGFALGGVIGVGSIVCIALVGPVAGIFLPINERIIQRLVGHIVSDKD